VGNDLEEKEIEVFAEIDRHLRHLHNDYGIKFRKQILDRFEVSNQLERKELCERYLIHNQYWMRRNHDPGFHLFLFEEMMNDKNFQIEMTRFIRGAIETILEFDQNYFYESDIPVVLEDLGNKYTNKSITELYLSMKKKELTNIVFHKVKERDTNYFFDRLEDYNRSGRTDVWEQLAIESLIQEHKSGIFIGPDKLFSSFNIEEIPYPSENYNYNFSFSNYKFMNISEIPDQNFTISNIFPFTILPGYFSFAQHLLAISKEIVNEVSKLPGINQYKMKCLIGILNTDNPYRIEYVTWMSTVLEVIWFNTHTLNNRIAMLNDLYPLKIKSNEIENTIRNSSGVMDKTVIINILSEASLKLFKHRYIEEGMSINNALSKVTSKYKHYSEICNIAVGYRELGDYTNAIKYYRKSLPHIRKFDINHYYIERKNYAECLYHVGNKKHALRVLKELETIVFSPSYKEQFRQGFNLANAYRRIGEFEEEYRILNIILKLENPYSDSGVLEHIQERIIYEMNNSIDIQSGKLNYDKLKEIERDKRVKDIFDRSSEQFKSYQLNKTAEILEDSLKLGSPLPIELLHRMISTYRLLGDKEKIEAMFTYVDEKEISDININSDRCFYHIQINELDTASLFFSKIIDKCINNQNYESLNYICIDLIKCLLINNNIIKFREYFQKTIDEIKNQKEKHLFIDILGQKLTYFGCFDEAEFFLMQAIQQKPDGKSSLELLAIHYFQKCNFSESLKYYTKLIKSNPNEHAFQYQTARVYLRLGDIENAKDHINAALEMNDTIEYRSLSDHLNEIWNNSVNIGLITNEDIKKMLRSAEANAVLASTEDAGLFDFSSVILGYSRAIERIIHDNITSPSITKLGETHGDNLSQNLLRYRQSPNFSIFKNVFTGTILYGRSISLGSWSYVINAIEHNSISHNEVVDDFMGYISANMIDSQRDIVMRISSLIVDDRNKAGHIEAISQETGMDFRGNVISLLNELIAAFY